MLLRLAWRNIWRNRRRTIISLLALAMGVMAIVTLHSVRIAAYDEIVAAITRGLVGDVQVHGAGYQDSPEISTVVADPGAVEAAVARVLPGGGVRQSAYGNRLPVQNRRNVGVVADDNAGCIAFDSGHDQRTVKCRAAVDRYVMAG